MNEDIKPITHIAVIRRPHLDAYELSLAHKWGEVISVVTHIEMQALEIGTYTIPPSPVMMEQRAAQLLADELWIAGIRPVEGHGSVGAMQQAEKHIASLQAQVAALTRIIEQLMGGNQ